MIIAQDFDANIAKYENMFDYCLTKSDPNFVCIHKDLGFFKDCNLHEIFQTKLPNLLIPCV